MRAGWWFLLTFGSFVAAACGSGDTAPPAAVGGYLAAPSIPRGGGTQNDGGQPSSGESPVGGAAEGGAGPGSLPIGHLGGIGLEENTGGAAPETPPECDPQTSWGNSVVLAGISTNDADERLVTMTHDELSLVFTRGAQLFIADRALPTSDFGPPTELALPAGYTHALGLALSPDGLALVLVADGGQALAEVTRATRSGVFKSAPDAQRFAGLNAVFEYVGEVSSPVLAASGQALFYTLRMASVSNVFRAGGAARFENPQRQDRATLGATDGKPKLTQSVAADERVLFVFDRALGHSVGLWSQRPGAPFTQVVNFPALEQVFTNRGCTRLYASRKVGSTFDVVLETPK